ncbi:DUF4233 domain-containing protein [Streptomyces sp. NPDC092296]|uniref:DUF4233 domain-containing protein n=1 Tax=Streptomyces sp. NPDC092296 TaxID=3366012 RepID=UPI003817B2A9
MRTLCSATLIGEALVVLFAALVAMQLSDVPHGTLWAVSGAAMVLCVLLCGALGRRGGVELGWALQIGLIASGVVVPTMYGLGAVFAGLWWCSVHYGRRIDVIKAARAVAADEAEAAAPAS